MESDKPLFEAATEVIDNPVWRHPGAKNKYDWEVFLDGRARKMVRGVNFGADTKITALIASAHAAAKSRGRKARCVRNGNDLIVQFCW